jgi:hypothetical protein
MTKIEAIEFLSKKKPLYLNGDVSQEDLDEYRDILEWWEKSPDPELIPLVLGSFGGEGGYGLNEHFYAVLAEFSEEQLAEHVHKALHSPFASVREAVAELCMSKPMASLFEDLKGLALYDASVDVRVWSIYALAYLGTSEAEELLLELAADAPPERVARAVEIIFQKRDGFGFDATMPNRSRPS